MKKIVSSGLVAGLVMLIAGMIVSFVLEKLFPSLAGQYVNANLFRPWSEPLMQLYWLVPFLNGLVLAYVWHKTKSLFPADRRQAAWWLGLVYACFALPGLVMSYSTFPVSLLMVSSWLVSSFVQAMLGAMVLTKMNK